MVLTGGQQLERFGKLLCAMFVIGIFVTGVLVTSPGALLKLPTCSASVIRAHPPIVTRFSFLVYRDIGRIGFAISMVSEEF